MPLNLDAYLGVHQAALKVQSKRMEVLANNLANVDTPNYKARDIDFRTALAAASGNSDSSVKLATTNAEHIATTPQVHARCAANLLTPTAAHCRPGGKPLPRA